MKSCCFTGHRNIKYSEALISLLKKEICLKIEEGVTDFYAGGALGWDTLCAETVIMLRDSKYPEIRLNLVLPCPEKYQTEKWYDKDKEKYILILNKADNIEILSDIYYRDCMKKRNKRLVELADCCICYYNNRKSMSGTGQTVRMAQNKGINIINIYQD